MVDKELTSDDERFERIVPMVLRPAAVSPDVSANAVSANQPGRRWLPIAFAGLLLSVFVVLFLLPKTVSGPARQDVSATAPVAALPPPAGTTRGTAEAPPVDVEAALQQRQQAEALATQWRDQQQKLAAMNVSQWAAPDAAAMAQQAAQADARFIARDFDGAAQGYQQALNRAQQLQAHAGEVLAAALADGQSALQAADAGAAAEAFARALSIDADNAEAAAGQRRARNFDAVKTLLNHAEAAEAAADLAAAGAGFGKVLALDGGNATARTGLARLQTIAANDAFAAQMSRGLAALDRGDYSAAQEAFDTALKMRAGATEAHDGLQRARLGLQSLRVQSLRETAQQAEADERWSAARAAYAAALAIDGSLAFAQRGLAQAEQRAALAARLQAHIEQAHRLTAQSVRADARAALADAAGIAAAGPQLQAQIQRLSGLLAAATTPIAVTLRSDGKTQVTLYPIGDLGPFASHSLSLAPGQYTAIGRRPGYREVRVAFTVTSQGVADAPFIQCEEPI